MPEMKKFIVVQEREVEVSANSLGDALQIAAIAFEHGQTSANDLLPGMGVPGMWGNTDTKIRETVLAGQEKRYGVIRKV